MIKKINTFIRVKTFVRDDVPCFGFGVLEIREKKGRRSFGE